jgi:peptidylprolyl isomerase
MGAEKKLIKASQQGVTPQRGDTVTVHCTGYGKNGDLAEKFWR